METRLLVRERGFGPPGERASFSALTLGPAPDQPGTQQDGVLACNCIEVTSRPGNRRAACLPELLLDLGKDRTLKVNRLKHFAAMVLIGDGVMAVVRPGRDANAWAVGPLPLQAMMRYLNQRPALTRLIGAVQIAGGVYWTLSSEKPLGEDERQMDRHR